MNAIREGRLSLGKVSLSGLSPDLVLHLKRAGQKPGSRLQRLTLPVLVPKRGFFSEGMGTGY